MSRHARVVDGPRGSVDPMTGRDSPAAAGEAADTVETAAHSDTADQGRPNVATSSSADLPEVGRVLAGEPIRRLVLVTAVMFLLAATLALVSAHRGTQISLIDETTHADYAFQIAHGHIPAKGDTLAPEILHEWSCRGAAIPTRLPACDNPNPSPGAYPALGYNYNFGHPPLYYAITGVLARAADAVVSGPHFVAVARATGVLWLFAAMVVMYLGLRRFALAWPYAFGGALLLPLCPGVLHATSMVSNDAPAPLAGATALWFLARLFRDGRIGLLAPVVATIAITATKVLNAMPMLVLACAMAIVAVDRWRRGDRVDAWKLAAGALGIGLAVLVVFKGWSAFQAGRGQTGWVNPINGLSGRPITGRPLDEIASTTFSGFELITGYWLQPQLDGETVTLWARLLSVLVTAAPFLALAVFRVRTPPWALGLATLGGMLGYPLIVELQVYLETDMYFPAVTPRYGMSLLPLAIGCLALIAGRLRLLRTSAVVLGSGALVMLLATAGVFSLGPP